MREDLGWQVIYIAEVIGDGQDVKSAFGVIGGMKDGIADAAGQAGDFLPGIVGQILYFRDDYLGPGLINTAAAAPEVAATQELFGCGFFVGAFYLSNIFDAFALQGFQ